MKKAALLLGVMLLAGCVGEETIVEEETVETETAESTEVTQPAADPVEEELEPLEVQPGEYTFGEDLKTGRYTVTLLDGGEGSVYVKNEDGFVEVGERFQGDTEYTFDANLYDTIETDVALKLNPAE